MKKFYSPIFGGTTMSNDFFPLKNYSQWLSKSLANGGTRQALRGGDHPKTAGRALQYLYTWIGDKSYLEEPLLLNASAVARTNIRFKEGGDSFGALARKTARFISQDSVDAKILAIYNQPLDRAHKNIVSILRIAESKNLPIDYEELTRLYLYWDFDPYSPKSVRRRMLKDYFGSSNEEPQNGKEE
jgi:CRISPR type I-E-associated protein CasB/Cse2